MQTATLENTQPSVDSIPPEGSPQKKSLDLARHLFRAGRLAEVIELCRDLLALDRTNHEIHRLMGLAYRAGHDLESAMHCFIAATRYTPDEAINHYNVGLVLLEMERCAEAITSLRKAIQLQPCLAEAYFSLGNALIQSALPSEAVAAYQTAMKHKPAYVDASLNLATTYDHLGLWPAAVHLLEKSFAASGDVKLLLRQGELLQRKGESARAIAAYARAESLSPNDPQLLERMGELLHKTGAFPEAHEVYQRLLNLKRDKPRLFNQSGLVLQQMERLDEAIARYREAINLDSSFTDAHFNLANALMEKREREEALEHYLAATRLQPSFLAAWFNLGVVFQKLGRLKESENAYLRVVEAGEISPQLFFNLAIVHQAQHRFEEAIAGYHKVLAMEGEHVTALYNLGIALGAVGRHQEAIANFRAALAITPENAKVLNNLGLALEETGAHEEAVEAFTGAISLQPDFAEAFSNLGNSLLVQEREEEALSQYRRAITIDPSFAKGYYNLGCIAQQGNEAREAERLYRQAIALEPDLVEAHWNLSNILLLQGKLVEGFREYRWRWKRKKAVTIILPLPEWQGEARPGETILIVTEQGKGDTLQFIRYLPLVRERVGGIIVACEQSLQPLLRGMAAIDQVINKKEIGRFCDTVSCYVPLLNLPEILGTTPETIPAAVPYLHADSKRIADVAHIFAPHRSSFKVGLVWRGNPEHKNDHNRSCPAEELAPLATLKNITLFSLQMRETLPDRLPATINLAPQIKSFADTAAMMAHLDLVLSVDTAVAHLAGALGRPVWILLPFVPDWRWMLDRDDSPWYSTMRLFRQTRAKQWNEVLGRVRQELMFIGDKHLASTVTGKMP